MDRHRELRHLAADLDRVDREVYQEAGRDPREPILGEGDPLCRLCVFGRDPGRHEVHHGQPFVGAGGQKLRVVLGRRLHGEPPEDLDSSLELGRYAFWANTVPYKPVGNKPWPRRVVRRFRPVIADLLLGGWRGREVLVLGRVAFDWFGLDDREVAQALADHWERDDRYASSLEVPLEGPGDRRATLRLHPLPHPSPLNAAWASRFPDLLDDRLEAIGWGPDTWRLDEDQARPAPEPT